MTPKPGSPAGLDRGALLALRRPRHDGQAIIARIRAHLQAHDGYVAFSGGKDSLAALHLALQAEPNVPVAFFDSGFEFPETYAYLAGVIRDWDLARQLHWINARHTTLEVLHATAAWDHRRARPAARPNLRDILIAEPSRQAHHDHGPGELWGVRAAESRGRAAMYARALRAETAARCGPGCGPHHRPAQRSRHGGVIRRRDGTVAYGPVWDWTTEEIWMYIARNGLPVNPVYAKLRRLGAPQHFLRVSHMLDGSRLEEGRVTWLRRGWPTLFDELAVILPRIREYVLAARGGRPALCVPARHSRHDGLPAFRRRQGSAGQVAERKPELVGARVICDMQLAAQMFRPGHVGKHRLVDVGEPEQGKGIHRQPVIRGGRQHPDRDVRQLADIGQLLQLGAHDGRPAAPPVQDGLIQDRRVLRRLVTSQEALPEQACLQAPLEGPR